MSANDNILAGVAGFAEGLKDVLVPYYQANQKYALNDLFDQRKNARDLQSSKDLYQYKVPFEREEKKFENDLASTSASGLEKQRSKMLGKDFDPYARKVLGLRNDMEYDIDSVGNTLRSLTSSENSQRLSGRKGRADKVTKAKYEDLLTQIKLVEDTGGLISAASQRGSDVSGFTAPYKNWTKETFGIQDDKDTDTLTSMRTAFADIGRSRGGTAFTETEKSVFEPIAPSESKDEKTNMARLRTMKKILDDKKASFEADYPELAGTAERFYELSKSRKGTSTDGLSEAEQLEAVFGKGRVRQSVKK